MKFRRNKPRNDNATEIAAPVETSSAAGALPAAAPAARRRGLRRSTGGHSVDVVRAMRATDRLRVGRQAFDEIDRIDADSAELATSRMISHGAAFKR